MSKAIDYTGKTFGYLTGICRTEETNDYGIHLWRFRCVCGTEVLRVPGNVKGCVKFNHNKPSCGCRRESRHGQPLTLPRPVTVGERFGMLTVIGENLARTDSGNRQFICRCDCGNRTIVRGNLLRFGQTRSCGHLSGRVKPKHIVPLATEENVA